MRTNDFYSGYESEPEIKFYNDDEMIDLWIGYFDQLMNLVKPVSTGWLGLSKYYHTETGWYDESPWSLQTFDDVIEELESIDINLANEKVREIYLLLLRLFQSSKESNQEVKVEYF